MTVPRRTCGETPPVGTGLAWWEGRCGGCAEMPVLWRICKMSSDPVFHQTHLLSHIEAVGWLWSEDTSSLARPEEAVNTFENTKSP